MKLLDIRQGITENNDYKAFIFHGGEVHFILKNLDYYKQDTIKIITRISNSDELILLMLVVDTIRKDGYEGKIEVVLPYIPYQQADRDFSKGESFSLDTISKLLTTLDINKFILFDPHSDVSPALLKQSGVKVEVIDNSNFIVNVLSKLEKEIKGKIMLESTLDIISPDAGAFKKIFKLCKKINWNGNIINANKSRNLSTGNIDKLELSTKDFKGNDVLIIDDICVGGRTFIALANKLKEYNCGKIYLAISHGVFSNGFGDLMNAVDKIFVTDSFQDLYLDDGEDFIKQINLKW